MNSFLLLKTIKAKNDDVSFLCADEDEYFTAFIDKQQIIYIYSLIDGNQVAECEFLEESEIVFMGFFNSDIWNDQICLTIVTKEQGVFVLSQKSFFSYENNKQDKNGNFYKSFPSNSESIKTAKSSFSTVLSVNVFENRLNNEIAQYIKNKVQTTKQTATQNIESKMFDEEITAYDLGEHFFTLNFKAGFAPPSKNPEPEPELIEPSIENMSVDNKSSETISDAKFDDIYINDCRRVFRNLNDSDPKPVVFFPKPPQKLKDNEDVQIWTHFQITKNFANMYQKFDQNKLRKLIAAEFLLKENIIIGLTEVNVILEWDLKEFTPQRFSNKPFNPRAMILNDQNKYESFDLIQHSNHFLFLSRQNHCFYIRRFNRFYDKVFDEKYKKINNNLRERSQTSSSNINYTLVAVNMVDRDVKKNNESTPISSDLYIYFRSGQGKITRRFIIDGSNTKVNMNSNIYVIVNNPSNTDMFITGDSNGMIVVWDVSNGVPISIFQEMCDHIGLFNTTNPILDLKLSDNCHEILVSTFYGVLSLYSAGAPEQQQVFPKEQFFSTDYIPLDEEPPIIDKSQSDFEFEQNLKNNIDLFMKKKVNWPFIDFSHKDVIDLTDNLEKSSDNEKSITIQNVIESKKHLLFSQINEHGLYNSQYIPHYFEMSQNWKKIQDFVTNTLKNNAQVEDKNQLAVERECKTLVSDQCRAFKESFKLKNQNFSSDELNYIIKQLIENGIPRQTVSTQTDLVKNTENKYGFENNSTFQNEKRTQNRASRNKNLVERFVNSKNEDLSDESDDYSNFLENKQTSRPKIKRQSNTFVHSIDGKNDFSNQFSQKRENRDILKNINQIEEFRADEKCFFCDKNGRIIAACCQCQISFNAQCKDEYGVLSFNRMFCLGCFLKENHKLASSKKIAPQVFVNCNRLYASLNEIKPFNDFNNFPVFCPQNDCRFYFLPKAFAVFVQNFKSIINCEELCQTMNKIAKIKQDFVVKVISYEYVFPLFTTKAEMHQFLTNDENNWFIFQNLSLEILTPFADFTEKVIKIPFCYPNSLDLLFLIPEKVYSKFHQFFLKVKIGDIRSLNNVKFIIKKKDNTSESLYRSIELTSLQSHVETRNVSNEYEQILVSPWDVDGAVESEPAKPVIGDILTGNNFNSIKIKRSINMIYSKNTQKYIYFKDDVDKELYVDYLGFVPVECTVSLILKRLENNFYKSNEHVIRDFELIASNARLFNDEGSVIRVYAEDLLKEVKSAIMDDRPEIEPFGEKRRRRNDRALNRVGVNKSTEESLNDDEILAFQYSKRVKRS